LDEAQNRLRICHLKVPRDKETAVLVSEAARQAKRGTELAAIQQIGIEADREFENASVALQACQIHFQLLQAELIAREAYFAQSELVDFIQSGRRELTPLNLAMAMAGLPRISARISCERCSALVRDARCGHAYLMFKAVRRVFREPPPHVEEAYESMRAYLTRSLKEEQSHISELRANWYFLKAAIESVYSAHLYPRASVPYRILASYKRLSSAQSAMDVLLAQQNRL
jgi:hypothetical protein